MLYEKRGIGGYFLTAYGIAVKHGFVGTEEEWLESLIGKEIREITVNDEGTMHIHYSKGPDDDVPIEILETLIGNVEEHEENAQAWATGYRGTEPVDDEDPAYENNATFYRNQARDYAAAAAESAATFVTDKTISITDKAADAAAVRSALLYVPMAISSFSITTPSDGKAEMGSTVTDVTLHYKLNQVPATLELDGSTQADPSAEADITLTGQSITKDSAKKSWTLEATDEGSPIHAAKTVTKAATLNFYNRVYWDTAAIPDSGVDDDFVTGLGTGALTDDTRRKVDGLNSTGGKYIWYAVPHSINSRGCKFKVAPSDFFSEFTLYSDVDVTNESGFQEKYDVYRSTNPNLGNTSMEVAYLN